jgi:hypothetical protein
MVFILIVQLPNLLNFSTGFWGANRRAAQSTTLVEKLAKLDRDDQVEGIDSIEIVCNSDLDHNEAVEHFPVGRRLAFDAAKGRLWVVCRKCERWNLTPLEERWEAIEECERAFRGTRLRVSTDEIGLARLREGLELVRIGDPQRPEMAAWRYGDQFGRRRRRKYLIAGGIVVVASTVVVAGPVLGMIGAGALSPMTNLITTGTNLYRARKTLIVSPMVTLNRPVAARRSTSIACCLNTITAHAILPSSSRRIPTALSPLRRPPAGTESSRRLAPPTPG